MGLDRDPLCCTNARLNRTHSHPYWTGVWYRLVEVFEVSSPHNAPVGFPIHHHKWLCDNDKHPRNPFCSDGSQSFPSLPVRSTGVDPEGSSEGGAYFVAQSEC